MCFKRSTRRLVWFCVLLLETACTGTGGGGGGEGSQAPENVLLESGDDTSGVVGTLEIPGVSLVVGFSAHLDAETGGATAVFSAGESGEVLVQSEVLSNQEGSVTLGGITIDGYGALSPDEASALASLAVDPHSAGLALVPLELGCLVDSDETAAQRAALVLPWQLLIKYEPSIPDVTYFTSSASCQYFPSEDPTNADRLTPHGGLQLAPEDPFPNVFGYFPLDGEGSTQSKSHVSGPCGAACRGVCGPDCSSPPCTIETSTVCEVVDGRNTGNGRLRTEWNDCGTAAGCREHDLCYDLCNERFGCGLSAAVCRHTWRGAGCDGEANERFGILNTIRWVKGLGPMDAVRLDFSHDGELGPMPDACPVAGTGGGSDAGTDAGTDGGGDSTARETCAAMLACVASENPESLGFMTEAFGPDGSCWRAMSEAECGQQCQTQLDAYHAAGSC